MSNFPKYNFFIVQEEKNQELMEIRLLLPKLEENVVSMSLKVPSPFKTYMFQSFFIVFLHLFTFLNNDTDDPYKRVAER